MGQQLIAIIAHQWMHHAALTDGSRCSLMSGAENYKPSVEGKSLSQVARLHVGTFCLSYHYESTLSTLIVWAQSKYQTTANSLCVGVSKSGYPHVRVVV